METYTKRSKFLPLPCITYKNHSQVDDTAKCEREMFSQPLSRQLFLKQDTKCANYKGNN